MEALSKPSLKGRFGFYILVGIILPIIFAVTLSNLRVEEFLDKTAKTNLQIISSLATSNIEHMFLDYKKTFDFSSKRYQFYIQNNLPKELSLKSILECQPYFESFFILSKKGRLVDGLHSDTSVDIGGFVGFDFSKTQIYKKIVDKKSSIVTTDIIKSIFTGNPTLAYARDMGEYIFVGHLDLNSMYEHFQNMQPKGDVGYNIIIADRYGTVIFQKDSLKSMLQRENISSNPLIQNLSFIDTNELITYKQDKEWYIGISKKLSDNNWVLAIFTPKERVFFSLKMLRENTFLMVAIIMVAVLLFYISVLRNIIKPILIFEQKVSKIAQGDYNIKLPEFGYKETSRLKDAFLSMAKTIQEREVDLERKIEDAIREVRQKDLIIHENTKRRAMQELLIDLAHQWRQPINACSIGIQNIYDVLDDKEQIAKKIEFAVGELEKLSNTITKLTRFYERGSSEMITLKRALELVDEFIGSTLKIAGISIDVKQSDDFDLKMQADFWVEILSGMILNVKQISTKRGIENVSVTIEASKKDVYEIVISDNAGGIDEELLPLKLFEPYVTTEFKSRDKGLGLYTIYNLIKYQLQGSIEAKNCSKGAKFTIRIPYARAQS